MYKARQVLRERPRFPALKCEGKSHSSYIQLETNSNVSPHGLMVKRITSNDEILSSILSVGNLLRVLFIDNSHLRICSFHLN